MRVVFEVSVHTQLRLQQTFSDGPLRPDTNPAFRAQTLAKEEGWPMYLPLPTLGPLFCARFLSSFAQTQALIPKRGRQRDLDKQKQLALSTRYLASRVSAAESPIPSPHPLCAECMLPRRRDFTSGSLFLSRSPRDKSSSLPCWCVACVTKTGHDGSDHDRGMPYDRLAFAVFEKTPHHGPTHQHTRVTMVSGMLVSVLTLVSLSQLQLKVDAFSYSGARGSFSTRSLEICRTRCC